MPRIAARQMASCRSVLLLSSESASAVVAVRLTVSTALAGAGGSGAGDGVVDVVVQQADDARSELGGGGGVVVDDVLVDGGEGVVGIEHVGGLGESTRPIPDRARTGRFKPNWGTGPPAARGPPGARLGTRGRARRSSMSPSTICVRRGGCQS